MKVSFSYLERKTRGEKGRVFYRDVVITSFEGTKEEFEYLLRVPVVWGVGDE